MSPITFMDFFLWVVLPCLLIAGIWMLGLMLHRKISKKFYRKVAMNMENKGEPDVQKQPKVDRLLKLFFFRQITYEFAAYALLFICILWLVGAIYFFIQAAVFVPLTVNGQALNPSQYLISIVSIRAGIILIVFFICQVLLRLYRYCLRFTAFYTGLFDALFIYKEVGIDLKDAVQFFTIKETLETAPESPSDKVIEMLKHIKGM